MTQDTGTEIAARSPKIGFVSLGCPKALTDSELILTRLSAEGYATSKTFEGADLVIVNTCGFIDDAVRESLDTIGEALADNGQRRSSPAASAPRPARAAATWCAQMHPSVLAVTGPHATDEVMNAVHAHVPKPHDPFVDLVPRRPDRHQAHAAATTPTSRSARAATTAAPSASSRACAATWSRGRSATCSARRRACSSPA